MTPTSFQHMQMAMQALFTFDAHGRMVRVNEADGAPAPYFFLGRTAAGNVWCFRHDLPAALVQGLDALCRREPIPDSAIALVNPPHHHDAYLQLLSAHVQIDDIYEGPEYRFPDVITHANLVMARRLAKDDDAALRPHFPWLVSALNDLPPAFGVAQDGVIVSACFSSRTSPLADEAGVNTVEAHWGKGFAPACVAAWANAIRALGRTPLYGTAWHNIASQHVARRLGLIQFGSVLHVR